MEYAYQNRKSMWRADTVLTAISKLGRVDAIDFDGFIQGESVECNRQVMRSWKGNPSKKMGKHRGGRNPGGYVVIEYQEGRTS